MDFAGLTQIATDLGPIAAIAVFFAWVQARQGSRLIDTVLVEIRELRASATETAVSTGGVVKELQSIRESLDTAKAAVHVVSERSTEHGQIIAVQGAQLREVLRRVDVLERDLRDRRAN